MARLECSKGNNLQINDSSFKCMSTSKLTRNVFFCSGFIKITLLEIETPLPEIETVLSEIECVVLKIECVLLEIESVGLEI